MSRSFFALAIVISCADAGAAPLKVSVHLDQARAASADIPVSGGTITATAADGTVITLTIPANALLSSERITMTPVSLIERLPMSGGLIAAVQLEPGGLQLWQRATLTFRTPAPIPIGAESPMAWSKTGDNFHLYPLENDPNTVTFKLIHFSGMGVSSGTDSDRAAQQNNVPCDAEDATIQRIFEVLGPEHERAKQGLPPDPTVNDRVAAIVRDYFTQTIQPAMNSALQSRNDGQLQRCSRARTDGRGPWL